MENPLSPDAWKCSICREMMYKPVVNHCGHLFCFWCLHKAMSPFAESRCPLCRAKFGHFPMVVRKLHKFLEAFFPGEYSQRAADTKEEEGRENVASPEFPDQSHSHSAPGTVAEADFLCDSCGKLLLNPAVLSCGHVICSVPCLDSGTRGGPQHPIPSAEDGCTCPVCGNVAAHRPTVCSQLDELLRFSFPKESVHRGNEIERELVLLKQQQEAPEAPHAPEQSTQIPLAADEATHGPMPTMASETERPMRSIIPSPADLQRWLNSDEYAHFGVGCDACGAYPIQGRRYRCQDCPEAVGFDLCGACYDRSVGNVIGRFNQRHTPDHRLVQVRPRLTSLHMLRAANPELSFDQLMSLVEMMWTEPGNDEPEQEANQDRNNPLVESNESIAMDTSVSEGGDEGEEESVPQYREGDLGGLSAEEARAQAVISNQRAIGIPVDQNQQGEATEPEVRMPRWRGPRPAPASTAEWPSPSAP